MTSVGEISKNVQNFGTTEKYLLDKLLGYWNLRNSFGMFFDSLVTNLEEICI